MLNNQYILYAFYAIAILIIVSIILKILKLPFKIIINSISGFITLYLINYFSASFNIMIPINFITSLIAGFLGIPGILLMGLYFYFL